MINAPHSPLSARYSVGLSLVELLVATLITLIGLLVITQVFAVYEGWKRTTTGVAQTQESGLLGAFAIEQDLRNAGFGLIGVNCTSISNYHAKAANNSVSLPAKPLTITQEEKAPRNDRIDVLYSTSAFANVDVRLQYEIANSTSDLYVNNDLGFVTGDLILLGSDGGVCSILQFSGKDRDAEVPSSPNVTSSGTARLLPHVPGDATPWNPPEGTNSLSGRTYGVGTRVLNLGSGLPPLEPEPARPAPTLINHRYYVQDDTLRMDELNVGDGSVSTFDLVPGVVGLRATCLPAMPCSDSTTAIRFGLVVRSGNREKEKVAQQEVKVVEGNASIAFWPGDGAPTLDLDEEALHYRYRVFQTVVPLKNIIWNPTP